MKVKAYPNPHDSDMVELYDVDTRYLLGVVHIDLLEDVEGLVGLLRDKHEATLVIGLAD